MPVTTVPKPFIVNMYDPAASRNRPSAERAGTCAASRTSSARSVSSPAPLRVDTGTIVASARNDFSTAARTSAVTSSSRVVDEVDLAQRDHAA